MATTLNGPFVNVGKATKQWNEVELVDYVTFIGVLNACASVIGCEPRQNRSQ